MTYEEEIALFEMIQAAVIKHPKAVSIINNAMMSGYEKRVEELKSSQLAMEVIASQLLLSRRSIKERNKHIANKLCELKGETFFNWNDFIEEHADSPNEGGD